MNAFRTLGLCTILSISFSASAQLPLVDITVVDNGLGELEVKLRPDNTFNGLFSALVFTIRWETASGATLGAVNQTIPVVQYIPTSKSGAEQDAAGYRYQIFAGFGFQALSAVGQTWSPGTEYTLLTIPVVGGTSTFEIVNDTWTNTNNGNYYVSLNGEDQTGVIYTGATGFPSVGAQGPSLSMLPNPTEGQSELILALDGIVDVHIDVLNAAGQMVWSRAYEKASGTLRDTIDLRTSGTGAYMVNVTAGEDRFTRRLVVK